MRKLLAAAALAGGFVVAAGAAQAADPLKVCFVYVGPHNDGGYSQMHDIGRQDVAKEFGDKVDASTYLENVPESDSEGQIRSLAQSGCKLIFTTSFGFMDATVKVASEFPDVKFEHATGFKAADNLSTYNTRWYEGRYVMGQIAAKMSKKGLAGYVVPVWIPEVVMGMDAFMLGAQSINPNFKIKFIATGSWFDPGKEADAANTLINQGADIIVQHTDSPAPMQAAEKAGVYGMGQAADMSAFGPKAHLASLIDTWSPYYIARTKAVLDGTWKSQQVWLGLKDGLLEVGPLTNMPDDVKKMAEDSIAKIKSGELLPFKGPVTWQDGTVEAADGSSIPDDELLGLNKFVKGFDDPVPQ
jgi:simple sugar transport system substrate-binding protein